MAPNSPTLYTHRGTPHFSPWPGAGFGQGSSTRRVSPLLAAAFPSGFLRHASPLLGFQSAFNPPQPCLASWKRKSGDPRGLTVLPYSASDGMLIAAWPGVFLYRGSRSTVICRGTSTGGTDPVGMRCLSVFVACDRRHRRDVQHDTGIMPDCNILLAEVAGVPPLYSSKRTERNEMDVTVEDPQSDRYRSGS